MSATQKVLVFGAAAETGSSVLECLLEADKFVLVRPSSVNKPAVRALTDRGVALRTSTTDAPETELISTSRPAESCGVKRSRLKIHKRRKLNKHWRKPVLHSQNPQNTVARMMLWQAQYKHSKSVRQDNQPSFAKFLGYSDAREQYADFTPISFRDYFAGVLDGKGKMPYHELALQYQSAIATIERQE
ncbi:hypothetical protein BBP40_011704 [Aspergillus hancockii]|nr:hypothetical protein BBP40_011704 [Aspergillus hancockii]